jgi:UDP-N-acetylglucosamine 4,6-dehydratase
MAPNIPTRVVGIRPGEKIDEVLCPKDDSRLTLEFKDHYVIQPAVNFMGESFYKTNMLGETGVPVADGFEYNSANNEEWLTTEQLHRLIGQ